MVPLITVSRCPQRRKSPVRTQAPQRPLSLQCVILNLPGFTFRFTVDIFQIGDSRACVPMNERAAATRGPHGKLMMIWVERSRRAGDTTKMGWRSFRSAGQSRLQHQESVSALAYLQNVNRAPSWNDRGDVTSPVIWPKSGLFKSVL